MPSVAKLFGSIANPVFCPWHAWIINILTAFLYADEHIFCSIISIDISLPSTEINPPEKFVRFIIYLI